MSTNNAFKIFKETELPSTLVANAMYLVASPTDATLLDLYITDKNGIAARSTLGVSHVRAIVAEYLEAYEGGGATSSKSLYVTDDITTRDAMVLTESSFVYVIDATGDTTVTTGGASYVYNVATATFTKVAEYESMDLVLNWESLTDKPESTPTQIDEAVAASHTHENNTTLNALSTSETGELLFNGSYPTTGLASASW